MEKLESIKTTETQKTYRIEHFDKFDVVVNLDYLDKQAQEEVLSMLKEKMPDDQPGISDLLGMISAIRDEQGNLRFFVKRKKNPKDYLDFMNGLIKIDPISPFLRHDFDVKSRYALIGTLSEIILSKKVKEIIASEEVQQLARNLNFAGFIFSEPIVSVVGKKYSQRYLIYKYIKEEKQTPFLCEIAVKNNGLALRYVSNQTEQICLEAVKQSGFAIQFIKNPTIEMRLEAIKQKMVML